MIKKTAFSIGLLSCLAGPALVNADTKCMDISLDPERESGLLRPTSLDECNAVWDALESSQNFPHIFTTGQPYLHPGLCYVSTGNGIAAKLGSTAINVSSVSAWTLEFQPIIIPDGKDTMATVISQWSVTTSRNKPLGKVFSSDTIDLISSSEFDVFTGGSDKFENAKGAVRIDSELLDNPLGVQYPPLVKITNISGKVCLPK